MPQKNTKIPWEDRIINKELVQRKVFTNNVQDSSEINR